MLKKLTEEKLAEILETGIAEFAEKGPEGLNYVKRHYRDIKKILRF
ncbi:hypothetical protein [Lutispora sp.]|jgi:hypothetical protein|nr:hypothetical protein [Lutispora sp.]MEA4962294.1 hypothetical protein [Lutispora sp.]